MCGICDEEIEFLLIDAECGLSFGMRLWELAARRTEIDLFKKNNGFKKFKNLTDFENSNIVRFGIFDQIQNFKKKIF